MADTNKEELIRRILLRQSVYTPQSKLWKRSHKAMLRLPTDTLWLITKIK